MNRRRLLSSEPPPIPFWDDCVFYAPLNTADNSDIISGVVPTIDSGSTAYYDANKKMWRLRANNGNKSALRYTGLDMGLSVGQEITMVIDIEEIAMYDVYQSLFATPPYNAGNCAYIRHDRYSSSTSPLSGRFCVTQTYRNSSGQWANFYKDGVFVRQVSWGNPNINTNIITICETASSSGRYYEVYASNARIYNRAMSAEEVANL